LFLDRIENTKINNEVCIGSCNNCESVFTE